MNKKFAYVHDETIKNEMIASGATMLKEFKATYPQGQHETVYVFDISFVPEILVKFADKDIANSIMFSDTLSF